MSDLPAVTIMIPTYNQANYLSQTIESALAQDYPRLEVVVSDDASTDTTADVVACYRSDSRLHYLRQENNLGRVANYRKLLYEYARGDFVLNLDGDDWLTDPGYISNAARLLDSDSQMVLVFAQIWSFREPEQTYSFSRNSNRGLEQVNGGNDIFLAYAFHGVSMPHLTCLYRRRDALAIGFYQHDIIASDTESLLRLILGRRVGFIDKRVAVWRHHASNASWSRDPSTRLANLTSIELPCAYASTRGLYSPRMLEQWRHKMSVDLSLRHVLAALRAGAAGAAGLYLATLAKARPAVALGVMGALSVRTGRHLLGLKREQWTMVGHVPE